MTAVKFGNNDKTRLAISSTDGSLTVCSVAAQPAVVQHTLRGHTKCVTGTCSTMEIIGANLFRWDSPDYLPQA